MFEAWRRGGKRLRRRPEVDLRWTRTCFCGQQTSDGPVADEPLAGVPFLTGSEENRGPLFDLTHDSYEGRRSPTTAYGEAQGHKLGIPFATTKDSYPSAVPLFVVRIADRLLITEPGEATAEVGRRARARVFAAARGLGVEGVTLMGLTNEFVQYLTTPEEYDRQHYEGGSTIYGPAEWPPWLTRWSRSPGAFAPAGRRRTHIRSTPATGSSPTGRRSASGRRSPRRPRSRRRSRREPRRCSSGRAAPRGSTAASTGG